MADGARGHVRAYFVFLILLLVKTLSRVFYRLDMEWIGEVPPDPWRHHRLVAQNVVSITRERDETWREVLRQIDPDAMVIILPEGRMKRASGLDAEGRPMTVRGGIADILETMGEGRMLLAYSGGLHHIQIPGQRLPRLFKTIRLRLEVVDMASYHADRLAEGGVKGFRRAVVHDLERRRDLHCPADAETDAAVRRREAGAAE